MEDYLKKPVHIYVSRTDSAVLFCSLMDQSPSGFRNFIKANIYENSNIVTSDLKLEHYVLPNWGLLPYNVETRSAQSTFDFLQKEEYKPIETYDLMQDPDGIMDELFYRRMIFDFDGLYRITTEPYNKDIAERLQNMGYTPGDYITWGSIENCKARNQEIVIQKFRINLVGQDDIMLRNSMCRDISLHLLERNYRAQELQYLDQIKKSKIDEIELIVPQHRRGPVAEAAVEKNPYTIHTIPVECINSKMIDHVAGHSEALLGELWGKDGVVITDEQIKKTIYLDGAHNAMAIWMLDNVDRETADYCLEKNPETIIHIPREYLTEQKCRDAVAKTDHENYGLVMIHVPYPEIHLEQYDTPKWNKELEVHGKMPVPDEVNNSVNIFTSYLQLEHVAGKPIGVDKMKELWQTGEVVVDDITTKINPEPGTYKIGLDQSEMSMSLTPVKGKELSLAPVLSIEPPQMSLRQKF